VTLKERLALWYITRRVKSLAQEDPMWATILPWIPTVFGFIGSGIQLYDGGVHGMSLVKALFFVALGLVTKARGTTGGSVAVTSEAATRNAAPGATEKPAKP
jgi:hypothetical protein